LPNAANCAVNTYAGVALDELNLITGEIMKGNMGSILCVTAILVSAMLVGAAERNVVQAKVNANKSDGAPTAEQKFKNIQVLKGIPADQLIPSMQFIAASLGVECEFCHVEHAMDKDDKKTKIAARKMVTMMLAINKSNFEGEREVTCYTCHRGAAKPVGTPMLSAENLSVPQMHEEEGAQLNLPTAQVILQKYLSAVGGADALHRIKTRIQKGNIEASGEKYPIDIYSEGPDKRVSISRPPSGASVTAFNGQEGWLAMPRGFHKMTQGEQQAASIDAQLYFAARLPELYQDFKVHPGEAIDGKPTYVVLATGKDLPGLRMYFDQDNGLLLRLIRYAETPLGRNPTEVDYADYRLNDGVKIPYRWTLMRTNGRFTIQIDEIKQNVPVDEKLFVMPAGQESR
jgi:photosynthetic reaction center cytochrome c subunit